MMKPVMCVALTEFPVVIGHLTCLPPAVVVFPRMTREFYISCIITPLRRLRSRQFQRQFHAFSSTRLCKTECEDTESPA